MLSRKNPENLEKLVASAPLYKPKYNEGLTDEQVKDRIDHHLVNHPRKTVTKSILEIIVKNVFSILNIILFVIAGFMIWLIATDPKVPLSRLFFFGILVLNIGISLFQDIKARRLVNKLNLISSPRTIVVRDKIKKEIPFNEIVLSDVILIKAGDVIPCDAILLHGSLRLNESLLSGEVSDVVKNPGDKIYAESAATGGYAYARVIKIGSLNYASTLQEKARAFSRPKSKILTSLTYIIRTISVVAIIVGVAEIFSYSLTGSAFPKMVDLIGSSIVAMVPIGMYLLTSIALTVGVIVLARHRVLVRELYSIEMLARVNVVCIDKTGTLTDGNMEVKELVTLSKHSAEYLGDIISHILYITKDDNLTAKALKAEYAIKSIKGDYSAIPFTSEKKFSAASFNHHTYALGAFGFLKIQNEAKIKKQVAKYEKGGHRILIIAEANGIITNNKLPNKMTAIGLIILNESIKVDARDNIEWFKKSNTQIRIISGDSVDSLKTIANGVGLIDSKAISLEGLSDEKVKKAVHKYDIFARVTPEQKKLIIEELRNMGNTVAMVGDGVNDLLALKTADCSIAMASGSNAAKAVSHLVSLDSNFSSLPRVVEEGRKVINNLQRVCSVFLVKTLFAIFMSVLFLCLPNYDYPFKTSNLLAWELLTIGIAPFFIALEPNKERIKGGFIRNIIKEAIPGALTQIIISLTLLSASYISPGTFPFDGILAVTVIAISLTSVIVLLHISMPLNKYRSIVIIGTVILMALFFGFDAYVKIRLSSTILGIDYLAINKWCWILFAGMMLIVIPLYFLAGYIVKKVLKRVRHD